LGEKAIRLVRELELYNGKLKVEQTGDTICIPLNAEPSPAALETFQHGLSDFEVLVHDFSEQEYRHLVPVDFLADKIPSNLLENIPKAIDFVGDIAIVEIPSELTEYKPAIGEAILAAHKHTKTVLAKSGAVEGVYRLRDFEVIAGVNKTVTVYREYGCIYHVDVARAYFSPRLSTEHNRVASLVNEGETVVDLFAGVGPFAVPIAKHQKTVQVYAIDVNPDAVAFLKKNVAVNRVEKQVTSILGDARQVVNDQLSGKADRVIMNLPETALDFVDVACIALKPEGGVTHFYGFAQGEDPLEAVQVRLTEAVTKNGRTVSNIQLTKTVREVAPYSWQVVVDARIQ
jgi:tRNA (guanine37-N1)-methyltransferase